MKQGLEPAEQAEIFEILNYDALSKRLSIPRRTLERMVSNNQIPSRKVGRFVRFYWPAIAKWLEGEQPKRSR